MNLSSRGPDGLTRELAVSTYVADGLEAVAVQGARELIDRADVFASVLGEERTDILVDALHDYLSSAAHDDQLNRELAGAYLR